VGTKLVALGGALGVLLALPHAFLGWPPIADTLLAAGIDPDLVAGISVGWYFGSLSMVASGAVVLVASTSIATHRWAFAAVLLVGLSYVVFGLAALLYRGAKPQFAVFLAVGAVMAIGAIAGRPRDRGHG
jgi:hypothetical protein